MAIDSDRTAKHIFTFALLGPLVGTLPIAFFIALAGSLSSNKSDVLFGIPIVLIGYPIGLPPSLIASCIHFWILSKIKKSKRDLSNVGIFIIGVSSGAIGILICASVLVLITGESKASIDILQKLLPLGIFSGGICALITPKILSPQEKQDQKDKK
jgi:hypothetical protein